MNTNYDQFLDNLNNVLGSSGVPESGYTKKYLSVENGRYKVERNKNSKNLNTAAINSLFIEAHKAFKGNEEKLNNLRSTIKKYKARLETRSRPWYHYVIFCFFFKSSEEKELSRIKHLIPKSGYVPPNVPPTSLKGRVSVIQPPPEKTLEQELNDQIQKADSELAPNNPNNAPERIKLYNMKMFDSLKLKLNLNGSTQTNGIKSCLDDLREFQREKQAELSPPENELLKRTIHELQFALEISILRSMYESKHFEKKKDQIMEMIQDRITRELIRLKPGECVVLPGGYAYIDTKIEKGQPKKVEKGHATLYVIKKEQQGASFTIVNTGEGANSAGLLKELSDETLDLGREAIDTLMSIIGKKNKLSKNSRYRIKDIKFKNLTIHSFDKDFISYVVKSNSEARTMEQINRELALRLKEKGGNQNEGREHKAQNGGACTVKSVTSFVNERLEKTYRKFKVFSTERELSRIADYRKDRRAIKVLCRGKMENPEVALEQMANAGNTILEKRTKKANKTKKVKKS